MYFSKYSTLAAHAALFKASNSALNLWARIPQPPSPIPHPPLPTDPSCTAGTWSTWQKQPQFGHYPLSHIIHPVQDVHLTMWTAAKWSRDSHAMTIAVLLTYLWGSSSCFVFQVVFAVEAIAGGCDVSGEVLYLPVHSSPARNLPSSPQGTQVTFPSETWQTSPLAQHVQHFQAQHPCARQRSVWQHRVCLSRSRGARCSLAVVNEVDPPSLDCYECQCYSRSNG